MPPDQEPAFIGREADLERLHELLRGGSARGRRVALVGMGGVGKTQLAAAYAAQHRKSYRGGVFWLNGTAPLIAELARLAEALDLRRATALDDEQVADLLRELQWYLHGHPDALLIFDDIPDPRALREPVAGVVPWTLPCCMIFTTRFNAPDDRFETYSVHALSDEVALELLARKARRPLREGSRPEDRRAATDICGALGGLPLAIVLAAAYLGTLPGVSFGDYLDRLHREGRVATADAGRSSEYGTIESVGMEATLRVQWNALVMPEARDVLRAASLIRSGAPIARAMLACLSGISDEAKGGYPAPLEAALNHLRKISLLDDLNQTSIRLHPLVREFAERHIEDRDAFADACARRVLDALGEMGRLEEAIAERGLDEVLADLRLAEALAGDEARESLRRLLRPLDREAHRLRRWDPAHDGGFFLQQVRNRCFELGMDKERAEAEATLRARGWAWLRARRRTSRESEALVRTLTGHAASVWGVAVTSDGRRVVSASHDGTLKLWDISSGCELRTLAGHAGEVNGVVVTRSGLVAVSASADATLKVWALESGREVSTLVGHEGPVNGVALAQEDSVVLSVSDDGTLKVWDLATGRCVRTLKGHEGAVSSVAAAPNGSLVLSGSEDCTLRLWDLRTGRCVHTLRGHTDAVMSVATTRDGMVAVSASTDHTLKIWNLESGREIRTLEGHNTWVNGVAVTPNGRWILSASSDKSLKIWDRESGREVQALEGHTDAVTKVVVTPDARLMVSSSHDMTLKIWELSTGREVFAHEGHASDVSSVAVTPDGECVVSASWDSSLKIWQLAACARPRELTGHAHLVTRVAVTSEGRVAVSASKDKTLKVWDLVTGRELRTLEGHPWGVNGVAVTPDGQRVLSASDDNTLKVWDLESGREMRTLRGHTMGVTFVVVTRDGRHALSASEDRTIKVWEIETGREVRTLRGHAAGVTCVLVTPDAQRVISASEDKTIRAWDLTTGQEVYVIKGHRGDVTALAAPLEGNLLASVSEDASIHIWDLDSGHLLATMETHAPLLSCAITPDGRTVVAGDGAGGLHVLDWIPASIQPQRPFPARLLASRDVAESSPDLEAAARAAPLASSATQEAIRPSRAGARDVPPGRPLSPAPRPEPTGPTLEEVRKVVSACFLSDSDLNAFCLDHFRVQVYARFTNGMDRVEKINCLLAHAPLDAIIALLRRMFPGELP